jgi:protein-tyrosine phosphatase
MIDLHNHILPGVDDGAADLSESVAIAQQFAAEGVKRIAATPHLDPLRRTGPGPQQVKQLVAEV